MSNGKAGKIGFLLFTLACIIGIGTCLIVDFALNRAVTWSWYPLLSVPFGWIVLSPAMLSRKHKLVLSMLTFSVAVLPYLYYLAKLTPGEDWFPGLGLPIAVPFVAALWIMAVIMRFKFSGWFKAAIAMFLFGVLADACAEYFVSQFTGASLFTLDNIISFFSSCAATVLLVIIGVGRRQKAKAELANR
jgi:hypothetical protein